MRTPRAAARSIAPVTTSRASPSRWKSYCARSSVSRAPSRNSAIQPATAAADWPPSVRVRTVSTGFVTRLRCARIGVTYNFYRDGDRASLLRGRLERYLDERAAAPILLVAEAPGYRGTRVSGIPLTSERQLTGQGPAEATATIVHRVLDDLGLAEHVLLWNVVPTHPHRPGEPDTNRPPTPAEVGAARPFLDALAHGRRVIAVGRLAERVLGAPAVRHPSHGGAAAFRAGLMEYVRADRRRRLRRA